MPSRGPCLDPWGAIIQLSCGTVEVAGSLSNEPKQGHWQDELGIILGIRYHVLLWTDVDLLYM